MTESDREHEHGEPNAAPSADSGQGDSGHTVTATTEGQATKSPANVPKRCRWCRKVLPARKGPGRPRQYCSQPCRQWDWVSRQRAAELQLSEGELVMARSELDKLHDDLYVLACAVEDTRRDLAKGDATADDLRDMLDWLLQAAIPLHDREIAAPEA